jgi:group I intron endonuclease
MNKLCGVYVLEFKGTRSIYIGSSVDIARRGGSHLKNLRDGSHPNPLLQNTFNKYGGFTLKVLEECSEEEVRCVEQIYLDLVDWSIALNLAPDARGFAPGKLNPMYGKKGELSPRFGIEHTKEVKERISDAQRGEKNPMYGRTHSEEAREKMSECNKGERHYNYGKTIPKETRERISKEMKRVRYCSVHPRAKPLTLYGVEYPSRKEAMSDLGLSKYLLRKLLTGLELTLKPHITRTADCDGSIPSSHPNNAHIAQSVERSKKGYLESEGEHS